MVSKHNQASQYQGTIDATSGWTAGVWSESIAAPCPICDNSVLDISLRHFDWHFGSDHRDGDLWHHGLQLLYHCRQDVWAFCHPAVLHTVTQWCHEVVPWRQNLTIRFLTKPTSILQCSCLVCKSGSSRVHALVGHRKWKLQQNKHYKSKQVFHVQLPSWQDLIGWNFS